MNKHPSEKLQSILTTKAALMSACCLPLLLAACGGGSEAAHDAAASASSTAGAVSATQDPTPVPTGNMDAGASPAPSGESSTASAVATGPVRQAATCAFDAVAAAASQVSLGTTVRVPAGDCNWGTQQLSLPAGVHLVGAGRDATIIRRDGVVPNTKYLVAFDCRNGQRAEFSGMTLVGNGNGDIEDKGLGLLNGCRDFRVSESRFTRFIFSAVYVGDAPNQRGVIYHNDFVDNYSAKQGNLGYGVVVYGGGAWPALELGSANAVFVENNWFSGNRHNIASNNGSVYVFRYNTVVGREPAKDYAMTDAHGLTSSSPRGSRSFEIYANHYTAVLDSGLQRTAIGIRGGDGVIYDNYIGPNISRPIELSTEGFSCGAYPGQDQIRSLYIWNNTPTTNGYATGGIDNNCPESIGLNRDYFLMRKPGYVPYAYPHPLRSVAP